MRASRAQRLSTHLCVVIFGLFAHVTLAQTANLVLLESFDKSVSFSGELIEAAEGQYVLNTTAGIVSIDVNTVSCTGDACPLVLPIFRAGVEVRLTSSDGAVSVTGQLIDIIDNHYVVDNAAVGNVRISTELVDCFGVGCPTGLRFADEPSEITASDSDVQVDADTVGSAENDTVFEVEAEQVDTELAEAVQVEKERAEAERVEAERAEAERVEAERVEAERVEAERVEAERAEAERAKAERAEAERAKAERVETERAEAERAEAERAEAERAEAERVEKERAEAERAEAERAEAERAEAERVEKERAEAEQIDTSDASISFAGSDAVGVGLIPFLLEDYADTLDASVDIKTISETETFVRYLGSDENTLNSMHISSTESSDAAAALETKAAVFGMTSRQINNDEARRLVSAGLSDLRNSDYESVIAVDSLAVITHSSNPVRELSMADLGAIYIGKIDNWSQVGGANAPITVLSPEPGSGARSLFEAVVFDGEEPELAEEVYYVGSDGSELAASVKSDPLAIGYVSFAFTDGLNRLDLISECGIASKAASFDVKTEDYPLGRRLYLYNRADNTPEVAKRFMEYATSPDADDAIAKSRFVNFAVERAALDLSRYEGLYEGRNEQSLAQLTDQSKDDLKLWDRFSTTVRFQTGSFILGKKEQNDIDRLVSRISELPAGTEIAVVGFTDDVGLFEDNLRLSRLRAQIVADAINSIARDRAFKVQINTRYFSERYASVCNVDAYGRAINRRVEVWLRK